MTERALKQKSPAAGLPAAAPAGPSLATLGGARDASGSTVSPPFGGKACLAPKSGAPLRRPALAAFLASLATAAVFLLPFILRRGGVLYVGADQITQAIPFTQRIVENLQNGSLLYDFGLDLGAGLVTGYTYYGLGSIFTLPLLLFPAAATPYLLGPALMLKFACSGLFSYLFLRLFTKTDLGAIAGSLLYSFSGFCIANLIFPFEDIFALFPLLLFALELAVRGEKRHGLLAAAMAVNALVNPAFFAGCVLFVAIYFVVRLAHRQIKLTLPLFLRLAAECVVGVLLSAFIALPFVLGLAGNPRLSQPLLFGAKWFVYVAAIYFETLRALVLPAEVMHANSLMLLTDAASPELYLPLFGLVPVFAYLIYKRRDWLKTLLLACFAILLVPVLNSAFNGFNHTYYTRWLYMPLLMAALATVLWLEDAQMRAKGGFVLWGIFAALFAGCMLLWKYFYGYERIVVYWPLFVVNILVLAAGLVCTGFSKRLWAARPKLLVAGIMAFAVGTGGANLLFNQTMATEYTGPLQGYGQTSFAARAAAPLPQGAYRIDAPVPSVYFGHGSPFSFTTTVPAGVFELQAAFGRQRTSASRIEPEEVGLWALLGVEYLLVRDPAAEAAPPNTELYYAAAEGEPYSILKNNDALPLIVGFDARIDPSDAEGLDNRQKSVALLHGLVLDEAAAAALPGLPLMDAGALPALGYEAGVARGKAAGAGEVTLGNGTVKASIHMGEAGAVLITLPFEAGWRCLVNGEETQLVQADWGLMAAAVPAGESVIELRYRPAGGTAGLVLSGIGLLGLAGLVGWGLWRRRKAQ